jgi:hypothetical protein
MEAKQARQWTDSYQEIFCLPKGLAVLQTSASAKYRRGSENENIGNIGENIGKCRKNEKQCCKNENIGKYCRP